MRTAKATVWQAASSPLKIARELASFLTATVDVIVTG